MEPQTDLILQVKEQIQDKLDIGINLRELSNDGQVYAELGAGYTEKKYTRGPGIYVHPILFMAKSMDEPDCIERLSRICNYFKTNQKVPASDSYQGRGLQIAAEPNKVGRQEDGMVLYSCIINYKLSY